MGGAGVLLVRRSVADVAVHADQSGSVLGIQEAVVRLGQHVQIVRISDMFNVPAVAFEAFAHILSERHVR